MAKTYPFVLVSHSVWPKEVYELNFEDGATFIQMYRLRIAQGKTRRSARRAGMWAVKHKKD